jgi:hypothetical protein
VPCCTGFKEIWLETLRADAMVGGAGAAGPAQEILHQSPGPQFFCVDKKVEIGIYLVYIQLFRDIPGKCFE